MDKRDIPEILSGSLIFRSASPGTVVYAVEHAKTVSFSKGDSLCGGEPSLCFMISGKAVVKRASGGQSVVLNVIEAGGVFGAAQLFSEGGGMTEVIALSRGSCLCISRETAEEMMRSDHGFSVGYIRFLSDRIRFLNRRIASFTAGDGEETLAAYLLSRMDGDGTVRLSSSMVRLSEILNLSRPTLYRAFTALSKRGLIEKNGRTVRIISEEKLKSLQ